MSASQRAVFTRGMNRENCTIPGRPLIMPDASRNSLGGPTKRKMWWASSRVCSLVGMRGPESGPNSVFPTEIVGSLCTCFSVITVLPKQAPGDIGETAEINSCHVMKHVGHGTESPKIDLHTLVEHGPSHGGGRIVVAGSLWRGRSAPCGLMITSTYFRTCSVLYILSSDGLRTVP